MAITTSEQLHTWQTCLESTLQILKSFAGQTEDQFLQLGERLQDFAIRSGKISSTANELVEVVSGDESRHLTAQLQQLFNDMETYLAQVRARGETSCQILQQVLSQLDTVVQPLEGFQKMDKVLRMLSISTKIESARIGELGAGFTTLALDVEKLSHAVNEKSAGIMSHRQSLELLIRDNLEKVRTTGFGQHADAARILADVSAGINTLLSLNETCSKAGLLARQTAAEVSDEIASVVSSMQFHDITRQQIEHVVEALENCGSRSTPALQRSSRKPAGHWLPKPETSANCRLPRSAMPPTSLKRPRWLYWAISRISRSNKIRSVFNCNQL